VGGIEELGRRHRARDHADEPVHRRLVALHGGEQLLHLGRRRLHGWRTRS
jgi:hypothetical protein